MSDSQTAYSLLAHLRTLPSSAGIYQYFDKDDKLLYVGKAKNLKNRIKSYFSTQGDIISPRANLSPRITLMITQVRRIHTLLTPNEQDALILENSLIKSLKPKYNILLRDDKTYPYIYLDKSQAFPRFEITRQVLKKKQILYFGPFVSGARELLESLYEIFPLAQKSSCLRGKKACVFHQINKCPAPCEGKISQEDYALSIQAAIDALHDKRLLLGPLNQKMLTLSSNLQFEEAAALRDRIQKLEKLKTHSSLDLHGGDYDVFVLLSESNLSESSPSESNLPESITPETHPDSETTPQKEQKHILLKLFIRDGRVVSSDFSILYASIEAHSLPQLYTQALLNHYKAQMPLPPSEILLPPFEFADRESLTLLLCQTLGVKLTITQPLRGKKKELLALGFSNAKEILRLQNSAPSMAYAHTPNAHTPNSESTPKSPASPLTHSLDSEISESTHLALLERLATLFSLSQLPHSIEVFDTSHHGGSHNVGGMVMYEHQSFVKAKYRRYELSGSDEYAQMREMLTRRAQKFESEPPPDLWLLDGGAGQLKIAQEILSSLGANVDVLAIAKEKRDYKAYRAKGGAADIVRNVSGEFRLKNNDPLLQFLQALRDEVHRYAISYHRHKKKSAITKAATLHGKTYSPAQLKRLLDYCGSMEEIGKLSPQMCETILKKRPKSDK